MFDEYGVVLTLKTIARQRLLPTPLFRSGSAINIEPMTDKSQ